MSGFFNITTIPRAIFVGFVVTFLALGLTSLYNLIVGDGGGVTPNALVYCALAGLIAGLTGYLFRDQRIMSLKAQGRLDPDSDGSSLPIGESPSTIPRLLGFIAIMTLVSQGIIALLSLIGLWWLVDADWGNWLVILMVVTAIGLINYFRSRRDRTENSLENPSTTDSPDRVQ